MNLKEYLSEQKEKVNRVMWEFTRFAPETPPRLQESMEYSLKAGGKRLRSILCLAACSAVGGNEKFAMPVAIAMEIIHTFSLIHDDLPAMDDDDLRRGNPTNHKVYGEAMAILAGDGLLAEAFYILSNLRFEKEIAPTILLDVMSDIACATGSRGMVGGQALDMLGEGASVDLKMLEHIHSFKTGRLITVSVTAGAKMGGASKTQLTALKDYGDKIGLAFQIADDILNVEGTKEETGKSSGSDNDNQKATYPKILGLQESKEKAQVLVQDAIACLKSFGPEADPLRAIAEYIVQRNT